MNQSTGAIRIAGCFRIPEIFCAPAATAKFARLIRIQQGALLVPQRAVSELQGSYQVAVVDGENKVSIRTVEVGDRVGTQWIIADGLKPGDRVVAEGVQKVRPGMQVNPKPSVPQRRREGNPMSKFFINRPIVAMVISIVMVIVGAVTMLSLPVAQFPNIAPPEIQVLATYVGADAQTLEQSVATPIEQQMSGVDNMNYMYSLNATGNSNTTLIVDFDVKTDPNTDLILTQARETQAASQLPADVTNYGVTVRKSVTAPLMLIALYSPNGTYDAKFLANYAYINLNDPLTRVAGHRQRSGFRRRPVRDAAVGEARPTGEARHHRSGDRQRYSGAEHRESAGKVGGEPAPKGQEFTYSVRAQGRLTSPEEFGQIVVRETPDGGIVRVKDVARIELGSQDYSVIGRLNGKPSAIIAAYQLPGSNAVDAAAGVKKLMAEMKQRFPDDMDYVVALDTTRAVTEGIKEIVKTLLIALVLVILVVYLFLQGWRATLIPLLAVPVSLVGTFVLFPAVRILHQHAFSVRSGAGDRPGGG